MTHPFADNFHWLTTAPPCQISGHYTLDQLQNVLILCQWKTIVQIKVYM